jgi:transcriptional regulator with XRE-family HTH domain
MHLRRYLSANGISPPDFAAAIGVSNQAVHRYVNGERIPRPDVMDRIKRATKGNVKADDFYPCREVA